MNNASEASQIMSIQIFPDLLAQQIIDNNYEDSSISHHSEHSEFCGYCHEFLSSKSWI